MSKARIIELLKFRFLIGQMTISDWYWSGKNRPHDMDPSQLFELGEIISKEYKELTKAGGLYPELKKFGIFGYYKDSLPFYDVLYDLVFDGYPHNRKNYMNYGVGHWFYLWSTHKCWSRKKFGPRNPDYALRDIVADLDMFICRELSTCAEFEMDIEDFWELERYIKLVLFPKIAYKHLPSAYLYRAIDRLIKAMEIFMKGSMFDTDGYDSKVKHTLIELYSANQLNVDTYKELVHNYSKVLQWASAYRNSYKSWDFRNCRNKLII